jgi:hypothetical protein
VEQVWFWICHSTLLQLLNSLSQKKKFWN